jgi:beta-CASP RNase J family ribonuclease
VDLPLSILPLGGLREIGMNAMLIGHRDRWVLVDCGVQFPDIWELGAQRRLLDLGLLRRWRDRIEAVLITHGHEDHIGCLPWALPMLDPAVPVHATGFARELIRRRLSEHLVDADDRIHVYRPGQVFQAGPFEVEAIRVTHSLPDCCALVLRSEGGTILHTGDWKIDERPMDGDHFDRAAFERVGRDGVTLLLSDSTNIRAEGRAGDEREAVEALRRTIVPCQGRVIVTLFASNLHRIRGLAEIAQETGRRLVLAGRSLEEYVRCAARVERAPFAPGSPAELSRLGDLEDRRVLVVSTGSQGERAAALMRAAERKHPNFEVKKGDLLIHSARVIPGNEASVYHMLNLLAMQGAQVVHGRSGTFHVSGHARQDELAEMFRLVRPAHLVPVHGEYTFLQAHAEFARRHKLPDATVVMNGELFSIGAGKTPSEARDFGKTGEVELKLLYNDGAATGDAEAMLLSERRRIAWHGIIVATLTIASEGAASPFTAVAAIETRALWTDAGALLEELRAIAEATVRACPPRTPTAEIEAQVGMALRRLARKRLDKKPEVIVVSRWQAPA